MKKVILWIAAIVLLMSSCHKEVVNNDKLQDALEASSSLSQRNEQLEEELMVLQKELDKYKESGPVQTEPDNISENDSGNSVDSEDGSDVLAAQESADRLKEMNQELAAELTEKELDTWLYKTRNEMHFNKLYEMMEANPYDVQTPIYKGIGIGSNYKHVTQEIGEPLDKQYGFNEVEGCGIEIWRYNEVDIEFLDTTASWITFYGEDAKDNGLFTGFEGDNVPEILSYCDDSFERYYSRHFDNVHNVGWYSLNDSDVLIISLSSNGRFNNDLIIDKPELFMKH